MRTRPFLTASAAALGLAATTALTACGSSSGTTPTGPVPATTTPRVTTAPSPATEPATAGSPTVTEAPSPVQADYSPIPEVPGSKSGLDFGILRKVTTSNGVVTLTVDRAAFYMGKEAKAHNKGKEPLNGYLLENTNTRTRTFVLDPKASLQGSISLRNDPDAGNESETLTPAEFLRNAGRALAEDSEPLIWLRHTDGLNGSVTAVSEQYTP